MFKHCLLLTDFHRELSKIVDLKEFVKPGLIDNVLPDAVCGYEIDGEKRVAFVEIEISNKGADIEKYELLKVKRTYAKYFPIWPEVILVSNYPRKSKIIDVINIKTDLSDIGTFLILYGRSYLQAFAEQHAACYRKKAIAVSMSAQLPFAQHK
jgi:hypothetical protein